MSGLLSPLPSLTTRVLAGVLAVCLLVAAACGAKPVTPVGFAQVGMRVGDTPRCFWLADTEALRDRGLMDVTSLGRLDGMLFRFDQPTNVAFYMYRTKLPLTVIFLSENGTVLGTKDMQPCPATNAADCPTFQSPAPYRSAVEVPLGRSDALGFSPRQTTATSANC